MSRLSLYGLDEAALGPRLGPFCACLTRFHCSGAVESDNLYKQLSSSVSSVRDRTGRLSVADSKVLFSGSKGMSLLETGLFTFLSAAGISIPSSFAELLQLLCPPSDLQALGESPWFAGAGELKLPFTDLDVDSESLKRDMEDSGICMEVPKLRLVTAKDFNRKIDREGGKAGAVRGVITSLLETALRDESDWERRVTVDRQGGRRYYGEWLADMMPGSALRALEEGPKRSAYQADKLHIEFLVGADGLRMQTALASMIAKYAREISMRLFNAWWTKRVPGLRPTAGYPLDATRFIAELKAEGALPEDQDLLIRRL